MHEYVPRPALDDNPAGVELTGRSIIKLIEQHLDVPPGQLSPKLGEN